MASPEGGNGEREKGRYGERCLFADSRFADSGTQSRAEEPLQKDPESFFDFLKQLAVSLRI